MTPLAEWRAGGAHPVGRGPDGNTATTSHTKNELGAKGFGWFVAGMALLLIGAALWIGLATTKECMGTEYSFGCVGRETTHAAQGIIVFLVLGGIGAVCMFAGYASRQKRSPN